VAQPKRQIQPGGPLSTERVLGAAVALADRDGIESLTMRKLAHQLGAGAMSLYYHVANKDELLDGMIDVVYSEIDPPSSGADWKTAMRRVAVSAREALARHRWAIPLMESRRRPGPASLRHHDAVLGRLREAGFSIQSAVHAFSALDSYVHGFVLQEQTLPFETPEELVEVGEGMLQQLPADEYPHLAETIVEFMRSGYQFANEFEVGLELVLDGLERLRDTA
jgi:AcrR family transcriptional regulator